MSKRILSLLLAVVMALPFMLGIMGIAHTCADEDCPVCCVLRKALNDIPVFAVVFISCACVFWKMGFLPFSRHTDLVCETPVLKHVRLND